MRCFKAAFVACLLSGAVSTAGAQGVISDNDCAISLNPSTLSIPVYGDDSVVGTSAGIVILTADFSTQGCSCVDPGDSGFDNPDKILLVTPANAEVQPFRFNDIDGYAQFEYSLTESDVQAGGGKFGVKVLDSCTVSGVSQDVLVDEAEFDVDFDFTEVPDAPPPPGSVKACVSNSGGLVRIVAANKACRSTETAVLLATPPATN